MKGPLHEDGCTFMISGWIFTMRNVWDKRCRENRNAILCSITFSSPNNHVVYEICDKYCRAGQATNDNIIWRMRLACCVTKATDSLSEFVILLVFHVNSDYSEVYNCSVVRMLPVLFNIHPKFILCLTANATTATIRLSKESVITVSDGNDYDSS
jgi:hypothetical protein